jgi:signal peptidase I
MASSAMHPTLIAPSQYAPDVPHQDRIVVNKWIYRISDPQRGDIAIFKWTSPHDDSWAMFSKRIVGLPGETVDIESPYVLINGKRLTDPPIFARISGKQDGFTGYCTAQEANAEGIPLPLTLGADEYFVLGDNSPHSFDSRFWGPVLRQDITGKVIRIFYPFDRIREIE